MVPALLTIHLLEQSMALREPSLRAAPPTSRRRKSKENGSWAEQMDGISVTVVGGRARHAGMVVPETLQVSHMCMCMCRCMCMSTMIILVPETLQEIHERMN